MAFLACTCAWPSTREPSSGWGEDSMFLVAQSQQSTIASLKRRSVCPEASCVCFQHFASTISQLSHPLRYGLPLEKNPVFRGSQRSEERRVGEERRSYWT